MIIYNGKNSLTDFDLYVAKKAIPVPTRKQITETVPYMSGLWDFSYLDGLDQYEAVTLVYDFDLIADSKRELNSLEADVVNWLHSAGDRKLYDTDISTDFYYKVYQAQASWQEDSLQGLVSVSFLCYPFRISREKKVVKELSGDSQTIKINNSGSRPVMAVVTVGDTASLKVEASNVSLAAGVYNELLTLKQGENIITASGSGALTIEYHIEVLK